MKIFNYYRHKKLRMILSNISDYKIISPKPNKYIFDNTIDFLIVIPQWTKVNGKFITTKTSHDIKIKSTEDRFYFFSYYFFGDDMYLTFKFKDINEDILKGIFSSDKEASLVYFILFIKKHILREP